MKNVEAIGAAIGVTVVIFTMGAGWNSIDARFDQMDERFGHFDTKLTNIQRAAASQPCLQILPRQIEAIEKGRTAVRMELEGLAERYRCTGMDIRAALSAPADGSFIIDALTGEPVDVLRLQNRLWVIDAQLGGANSVR